MRFEAMLSHLKLSEMNVALVRAPWLGECWPRVLKAHPQGTKLVWRCMPAIPGRGKQGQELKVILGYVVDLRQSGLCETRL